jgi:hypothetical protein
MRRDVAWCGATASGCGAGSDPPHDVANVDRLPFHRSHPALPVLRYSGHRTNAQGTSRGVVDP